MNNLALQLKVAVKIKTNIGVLKNKTKSGSLSALSGHLNQQAQEKTQVGLSVASNSNLLVIAANSLSTSSVASQCYGNFDCNWAAIVGPLRRRQCGATTAPTTVDRQSEDSKCCRCCGRRLFVPLLHSVIVSRHTPVTVQLILSVWLHSGNCLLLTTTTTTTTTGFCSSSSSPTISVHSGQFI